MEFLEAYPCSRFACSFSISVPQSSDPDYLSVQLQFLYHPIGLDIIDFFPELLPELASDTRDLVVSLAELQQPRYHLQGPEFPVGTALQHRELEAEL